jgi:copper chaperone
MIEVTVPGMSCGPCARAVTGAVQGVDPSAEVKIDLNTKRVSINSSADPQSLATAIENAGYKVEAEAA